MGKTGKWIRNFLIGKKDKDKEKERERDQSYRNDQVSADNNGGGYDHHHRPTTPISIPQQPTTPKEKRRWSFRRSSAAAPPGPADGIMAENDTKKHAMAVAVATAAAADAAVAAAKAAAAVIHLTSSAAVVSDRSSSGFEDSAATMIQSVFRGYLARKALNALKGLVKLQALVRGHLVRKQATVTLRCMQALVTVQARARAQRLRMAEEIKSIDPRQFHHRKSTQENRFRNSNQNELYERSLEENIKIVEMDLGDYNKPATKARNSYSNHRSSIKQENHNHHNQIISPSQSTIAAETSPKTYSNHFDEHSFGTAQSSPQCHSNISKPPSVIPFSNYPKSDYAESLYSEFPFYPSYMANTESSRAKARSHSAPKQRPVETFERQMSSNRRRPSLEGRNVPRAVRMQRSSSQVGPASQNYQYPWSVVKLDRSAVSLKDSECGSTSTMLTNTNYCRSLVGFEVQGARY